MLGRIISVSMIIVSTMAIVRIITYFILLGMVMRKCLSIEVNLPHISNRIFKP